MVTYALIIMLGVGDHRSRDVVTGFSSEGTCRHAAYNWVKSNGDIIEKYWDSALSIICVDQEVLRDLPR